MQELLRKRAIGLGPLHAGTVTDGANVSFAISGKKLPSAGLQNDCKKPELDVPFPDSNDDDKENKVCAVSNAPNMSVPLATSAFSTSGFLAESKVSLPDLASGDKLSLDLQ